MIVYRLSRYDPDFDDRRGGWFDDGEDLYLHRDPVQQRVDEFNAVCLKRLNAKRLKDWKSREKQLKEHNALVRAGLRDTGLAKIDPFEELTELPRYSEKYEVEELEVIE